MSALKPDRLTLVTYAALALALALMFALAGYANYLQAQERRLLEDSIHTTHQLGVLSTVHHWLGEMRQAAADESHRALNLQQVTDGWPEISRLLEESVDANKEFAKELPRYRQLLDAAGEIHAGTTAEPPIIQLSLVEHAESLSIELRDLELEHIQSQYHSVEAALERSKLILPAATVLIGVSMLLFALSLVATHHHRREAELAGQRELEVLSASEERYRGLFQHMITGNTVLEMIYDSSGQATDYRFQQVNPAFGPLTGLDPEITVGATVRELIPGLDKVWIDSFAEVDRTGCPASFQLPVPALKRWFAVNAFQLQPGIVVASFTDITDELESRRRLRASEERFRMLLRSGEDILMVIKIEKDGGPGVVSEANDAACRQLGYEREEMLGMGIFEFDATDYSQPGYRETADVMRETMEEGSAVFERMMKRKDGTSFPVEISTQILHMQGEPVVVSLARDITERKEAERRLRESEQSLTQLIENMSDGLAASRLVYGDGGEPVNLKHTYVNAAYEDITGLEASEVVGKTITELMPGFPAEMLRRSIAVAQAGGPDAFEFDIPDLGRRYRVRNFQPEPEHLAAVITDVTEEHKEQLEREFLSAILRTTDDISVIKGLDLRVIAGNQAFADAAGLDSPEQLIGKTDAEIFGVSEDTEPVRTYMEDDRHAQQLPPGEFIEREEKVASPDGTVSWVQTRKFPVFDSAGKLMATANISRDITGMVEARQQLSESHQRMELAADAARFGVWELDLGENKLVWDKWMYRLYGISPDSFGGAYEAWQAGLHPDDVERATHEVELALAGEKEFDTTFRVIHPDGTVRHIKVLSVVVRDEDGSPLRMIGINYDITSRVEAERSVRESEVRLRDAQAIAKTGSFELDWEKGFLSWSDQMYHLHGLEPGSQMPRMDWLIGLVHEGEAKLVGESVENARRGISPISLDFRIHHPGDGEVHFMHLELEAVKDSGGNPTGVVGTIQDISERKQVELELASVNEELSAVNQEMEATNEELTAVNEELEASNEELRVSKELLEESEEKFRLMAEQSLVGVMIMQDGEVQYANDAFAALWGMQLKDALELALPDFIGMVHPDDQDHVRTQAQLKQSGTGAGVVNQYQFRINARDGKLRWAEIFSRTVHFEGEPANLMAILDITERRLAEERLRESEETLSDAMRMATAGHWEYDVASDTFTFNDNFYSIYKTSARDAGGYEMSSAEYATRFVHPEDAAVVGKEVQAALQSSDPNYSRHIEHRIVYPDGGVGHISVRLRLVKGGNGETVALFGVNQNITELKQAEAMLRESEERLNLAARSAGVGIYDWDIPRDIVKANDVLIEGIDLEADGGQYSTRQWIKLIHPEDTEHLQQALEAHLAGDTGQFAAEFRLRAPGGGYSWFAGRGQVVERAPEGSPLRMVGTQTDITEQRNTEHQLRQAQKMAAIGTLAGGIAHDFNNILFAITGNADLAYEMIPEDNRARRNLAEVISAGQRAAALVKQLLAFARPEQITRTALQPALLIKEVSRLLRATLPAHIEINVELEERNSWVVADPTELHQVLMNLCTNAGQAMIEDGGQLTIRQREVRLDGTQPGAPGKLSPGRYVLLSVSDTGVGIPADVLPRIFEPFYTTRDIGQGTGMGLAVVHSIARSLGGTIAVDSKEGKGTTFSIYLPASAAPSTKHEHSEQRQLPGGSEHILLVDDEAQLTELLTLVLEKLGYRVTAVHDGEEAFGRFAKNPEEFDAVITDQAMPRMTGDKLARRLLAIRENLPVILVTGYSQTVTPEQAASLGIKAYLTKPVDRGELARKLRELLDAR